MDNTPIGIEGAVVSQPMEDLPLGDDDPPMLVLKEGSLDLPVSVVTPSLIEPEIGVGPPPEKPRPQ